MSLQPVGAVGELVDASSLDFSVPNTRRKNETLGVSADTTTQTHRRRADAAAATTSLQSTATTTRAAMTRELAHALASL
jgi:hypothetical protein